MCYSVLGEDGLKNMYSHIKREGKRGYYDDDEAYFIMCVPLYPFHDVLCNIV